MEANQASEPPGRAIDRPTGGPTIWAGLVAMLAAAIIPALALLFFNFFDLVELWIAGPVFEIGLLLFGVGQIQKALWFLPGDGTKFPGTFAR